MAECDNVSTQTARYLIYGAAAKAAADIAAMVGLIHEQFQ